MLLWLLEDSIRLGPRSRSLTTQGPSYLVSSVHARATRQIGLPHRDPFDALLVAQAATEALVLITADSKILDAGLHHVHDARV